MSVATLLPSSNADGNASVPSRAGKYLEAVTYAIGGDEWASAAEGSRFVCTNATLATGIAGHAAPVVADTDTKPLFFLFNAGPKTIYFKRLFLEVTAAGTGGTIQYTVVYIDQKGATARSSGGTQITALNNCNTASGLASGADVWFGPVVAAMSNSKKVGQQIVREVIPVVQDRVSMYFGCSAPGINSGLTTAGTATNNLIQYFPAMAIAPGGNLNISQIRPSQSAAASYQFEAEWMER